ncbi:MAG: tetratricopeptide repeat protein [bacterium]|nr:tetratricopeptide repeat protein [bacterium]
MRLLLAISILICAGQVFAQDFETTAEAAEEINKGSAAMSEGDYDTAIAHFKKALSYDPALYIAYDWIAHAQMAQGDYEGAVATLKPMVASHPNYANGYNNLALAYFGAGLTSKAEYAASTALDIDPDFANARSTLGSVYMKQAHYDMARIEFEKAIELEPEMAEPYYGIAEINRFGGNVKEAGDYYVLYLQMGAGDERRRSVAIDFLWDHQRGAEVP